MISRKKIILKTAEDHLTSTGNSKKSNSQGGVKNGGGKATAGGHCSSEEEFFADAADDVDENTWFSLEQLISDQISEIINKWSAIDDEIWGKVVCFERNRRIAKVYARSQVLSVSGSECDFDGSRIGLNAFPNGRRDEETVAVKRQIKSGFKLKIDDRGNLYIKRVGKCAVYVATGEDCLQSSSAFPSPSSAPVETNSQLPVSQNNLQNGTKPVHFRSLEANSPLTIFDMGAFLGAIADWSARHPAVRYPPADFLERFHQRCVHLIQVVVKEDGSLKGGEGNGNFSSSNRRLLRHPCWIVLVNIVGLDLLWSRFGYSSMILLNQTQLVSLRSCFALGGPSTPEKSFSNRDDDYSGKNNRRHDSDDLYYSGYRAKISAHSAAAVGVPSGNGNGINGKNHSSSKLPSTKLPISPSSALLLSRFANRQNENFLYSPSHNNNNLCGYQPNFRNGGPQFYYNNSSCSQFNSNCENCLNNNSDRRANYPSPTCSGRFSQIPRLIIGSKREFIRTGGDCRGQNSLLNSHHRRLARSSTHLTNFTTTTAATSSANSSTANSSEDNSGALTSSSSAEELFAYHPSKYRGGSTGNGSGHQPNNNSACDSSGGGGGGGKKKFKSSNNGNNGNGSSSQHHRRLYTRHNGGNNGRGGGREGSVEQSSRKLQLLHMRKLSSSNLELSSGTFYDLEEESGKKCSNKSGAGSSAILKKANSD